MIKWQDVKNHVRGTEEGRVYTLKKDLLGSQKFKRALNKIMESDFHKKIWGCNPTGTRCLTQNQDDGGSNPSTPTENNNYG